MSLRPDPSVLRTTAPALASCIIKEGKTKSKHEGFFLSFRDGWQLLQLLTTAANRGRS